MKLRSRFRRRKILNDAGTILTSIFGHSRTRRVGARFQNLESHLRCVTDRNLVCRLLLEKRFWACPPDTTRLSDEWALTFVPSDGLLEITSPDGTVDDGCVVTVPTTRLAF